MPIGRWEVVDVAFPNADEDVGIVYSAFRPENPSEVRWVVLSIDKGGVVYRDSAATQKAWSTGLVFLRCSAANATARVLLFVEV